MRRYEYECNACHERFDIERPTNEAGDPTECLYCGEETRRIFSVPKFLFKGDPNDNRPIWHNHGRFGHAYAPRRGFHPPGVVDDL